MFRLWSLPCPVAEVENLYEPPPFVNSVIHKNRAVYQFPHLGSFSGDGAHARIASWHFNVIQQPIPKAGCGGGIILSRRAENFREIVQQPLRVEESVIHFAKSLRASSGGTVRPA